jgi:tuftelin-interacting protein 11
MYTSSEWDKLMLQFVVPKLGHSLRDDFRIDPSDQNMQPLEQWVLPWYTLLRSSVFVHLLDVELWPAWLEILYIWLASPGCKPDEVASWYAYLALRISVLQLTSRFTWWKSRFPGPILDIRGVQNAFKQGLELMDSAMRLGSTAPDRLRKPVYKPLPPTKTKHLASTASSRHSRPSSPAPIRLPADKVTDPTEITFRSLAEEAAAARDLIFLPLGRSHAHTGKPLFRVAKGVDGKGGVTVYIGDNAVFVQGEDGGYRAVTLEDMVKRAGG